MAAAPRPRRLRAPGRGCTRGGSRRLRRRAATPGETPPPRTRDSARCRLGASAASDTPTAVASTAHDGEEPVAREQHASAVELGAEGLGRDVALVDLPA